MIIVPSGQYKYLLAKESTMSTVLKGMLTNSPMLGVLDDVYP